MTATSTSVEAWHELRNSPLLGRQQLEVLRMLRSHGPATAKELFAASNADITLQKRLPELVELGLVERLEPRACRVTGRSAQVWAAVEAYRFPSKGPERGTGSGNVPERPGTTFQSTREVSPSPRVPAPAEVGRGVFPLEAFDPERGTLYRGSAPVTGPQCACGTKNPCPTGEHCRAPGHARCRCEVAHA